MNHNDIERTYDRVLMKIKLIGLYQIIGGIIGIGMFIGLVFAIGEVNLTLLLLLVLSALLFCYSIFCGVMHFRNPALGLRLTFINQLIQVFQLALLGYYYKYISGFGIMIGADLTDDLLLGFSFDISSFQMHFDTGSETSFVKINIVAPLLAYYSLVLQERYQAIVKEREIVDIEDIGV